MSFMFCLNLRNMAIFLTIFSFVCPLYSTQMSEALEQKAQEARREISPEEQKRLNEELVEAIDDYRAWDDFQPVLDLIQKGADIYATYTEALPWIVHKGQTLFEVTMQFKNEHLARLLIDKLPNINVKISIEGRTPLMLAVLAKKPELVKYILKKSASVDLRDRHGYTALMLAIQHPIFPPIVKLLLQAGANPLLRAKATYSDAFGNSPQETARMMAERRLRPTEGLFEEQIEFNRKLQATIKMLKEAEDEWEKSHLIRRMELPKKAIEAYLEKWHDIPKPRKNDPQIYSQPALMGRMISGYLAPNVDLLAPEAPPLVSSIRSVPLKSITVKEWIKLKKLTKFAQKNQLSLDDEEKFEQLVETIDRETKARRAPIDSQQRELLDLALKELYYIKSRRLID